MEYKLVALSYALYTAVDWVVFNRGEGMSVSLCLWDWASVSLAVDLSVDRGIFENSDNEPTCEM